MKIFYLLLVLIFSGCATRSEIYYEDDIYESYYQRPIYRQRVVILRDRSPHYFHHYNFRRPYKFHRPSPNFREKFLYHKTPNFHHKPHRKFNKKH